MSNELSSLLGGGIRQISNNAVTRFDLYVKIVVPIDGYIFLVLGSSLSSYTDAQLADLGLSAQTIAEFRSKQPSIEVSGSLHFAPSIDQQTDAVQTKNRILFTTQNQVKDLNIVDPGLQYVGNTDEFKFSFGASSSYYKNADTWHYLGMNLLPTMQSQLVSSIGTILDSQVVSNSIPYWFMMAREPGRFQWGIPIYPAMLSPDGIADQFATIKIRESISHAPVPYVESIGIAANPKVSQLCQDTVDLTFWGLSNDDIFAIQSKITAWFHENMNVMGLIYQKAVQDQPIGQREFLVVAKRKTVQFAVSYIQGSNSLATLGLIRQAQATFTPTRFSA